MPEPLALEPGNVIGKPPSTPPAAELGKPFVVPGIGDQPEAKPLVVPGIGDQASPPETKPGVGDAPQAAPSPLAQDAQVPLPPAGGEAPPKELSVSIDKDQFEPGLGGNIDKTVGYTNRLTIGAIKSIFHMDPNYVLDAAKGEKIDFDKDIDNLINNSDPRAWSPVALMAPVIRAIGPKVGLGDAQHTEQWINQGISNEVNLSKGALKFGASFIDPMILADPVIRGIGGLIGKGAAAAKVAGVVEKAMELHPANLLVKAPLAAVDKLGLGAIAGVSKLVGSSIIADAAKAYSVENIKGFGDFVPMGRVWSSKALVNSPQVLMHGLTSGFNSKATANVVAGFTKAFGHPLGGMVQSQQFMQDLAKDADPKFLMLKFGQAWEDSARPIIDDLVKTHKVPAQDAQNLVRDMATARLGSVDKKLAQLYPEQFKAEVEHTVSQITGGTPSTTIRGTPRQVIKGALIEEAKTVKASQQSLFEIDNLFDTSVREGVTSDVVQKGTPRKVEQGALLEPGKTVKVAQPTLFDVEHSFDTSVREGVTSDVIKKGTPRKVEQGELIQAAQSFKAVQKSLFDLENSLETRAVTTQHVGDNTSKELRTLLQDLSKYMSEVHNLPNSPEKTAHLRDLYKLKNEWRQNFHVYQKSPGYSQKVAGKTIENTAIKEAPAGITEQSSLPLGVEPTYDVNTPDLYETKVTPAVPDELIQKGSLGESKSVKASQREFSLGVSSESTAHFPPVYEQKITPAVPDKVLQKGSLGESKAVKASQETLPLGVDSETEVHLPAKYEETVIPGTPDVKVRGEAGTASSFKGKQLSLGENPSARSLTTAELLEQHYANMETSIKERAAALGIPEDKLYGYGGQISKTVEEYEHDLALMSQQAVRATGQEESQAKTIADFYQHQHEQATKLIYDFDETLQTLSNSGIHAPIGASPSEMIAHVEKSIKDAPPEVINQLLHDGSIARLPLMTDDIAKAVLDKSTEVSPLVKIDAQLSKNIQAQKQVMLETPKVAYERSMKTIRQELQKSTIADQIPREAEKFGWGGKDQNLIKKGYSELDEQTIRDLGPKGEQLRGLYLHPQAKAMIENLTDLYTNPEKMNDLVKPLYALTSSWKTGVLSNPVTVLNNMAGNMLQAQLAKVNPAKYPETLSLMKKFIENPMEAYKDPVIKELIDSEALSGDFVRGVLNKRGYDNTPLWQKLVPASDKGLVPRIFSDVGAAVNTTSDEFFMAASYLSQRERGMAPNEAKRYANQFWYNTSDLSKLTPFERTALQPLIPFWRWMKNNIPGQISNLVKNPFSSLFQIEMYHRMGLAGDTFIPNPYERETTIGHISDSGEIGFVDKSSAVPAMDLVKLGTGLQLISQGGTKNIANGLGHITGLGPTQGISPLISVPVDLATKWDDKSTKNLAGFDVDKYTQTLATAVPGLRDLDILLRGTGLAGQGPVNRGILSPPERAHPGILGGAAPTSIETRNAKENLMNFFGAPTQQLLSLKNLNDMKPNDRNSVLKAAQFKLKEMNSRPYIDPEIKSGMDMYTTILENYVIALNNRDNDRQLYPMAQKKELASMGIDELEKIETDKASSAMSKELAKDASKMIKEYSKSRQGEEPNPDTTSTPSLIDQVTKAAMPPVKAEESPESFGKRADGSPKGLGYFGSLKRPDGGVSTELSVGVEINGKETEIPSLVPTLSRKEIDYLLTGGEPTPQIVDKAQRFAETRLQQGKPVWATKEEESKTKIPGVK